MSTFLTPVIDFVRKTLCGGGADDENHRGSSDGNNRSANISCTFFNNVICCGKSENCKPSLQTSPQQNDGMQTQCQCGNKGTLKGDLQPKDEVPEGTSSESKKREGDGKNDDDPTSPLSSENSLPSVFLQPGFVRLRLQERKACQYNSAYSMNCSFLFP